MLLVQPLSLLLRHGAQAVQLHRLGVADRYGHAHRQIHDVLAGVSGDGLAGLDHTRVVTELGFQEVRRDPDRLPSRRLDQAEEASLTAKKPARHARRAREVK
jgi:hypothetical protein